MAWTNRLTQITCGLGPTLQNDTLFTNVGVALSGASQQSTTLPSSGSFAPTISKGYLRIKIYEGTGTSPTITDIVVTATDGTNTVQIFNDHPNAAINLSSFVQYSNTYDKVIIFETELNLTSITVKTTLGGTSTGVLMDLEVAGTI